MASRIVPAALMGIGADLAGKLASPHLLQGSLRLHACRISALLSGRWRETGFLGQGDRAIAFGTGNDCRRCVAAPPPLIQRWPPNVPVNSRRNVTTRACGSFSGSDERSR